MLEIPSLRFGGAGDKGSKVWGSAVSKPCRAAQNRASMMAGSRLRVSDKSAHKASMSWPESKDKVIPKRNYYDALLGSLGFGGFGFWVA